MAEIRVGLNTRNVAASADGRWLLAGNTCQKTWCCWTRAPLQPVKTLPVRTQQGQLSRVSAVYDAAPRQSFIVALKDAPELGNLLQPGGRADLRWLCPRLRHGRGPGQTGFSPRRTPLDAVLDDFFFDPDYRHVIGASRDGRAQVVNLDIRRQVAALQLDGMPHLGAQASPSSATAAPCWPPQSENRPGQRDRHRQLAGSHLHRHAGAGVFLRSHERTPYAWVDSMMSAQRDTLTLIDKRTLQVAHTCAAPRQNHRPCGIHPRRPLCAGQRDGNPPASCW